MKTLTTNNLSVDENKFIYIRHWRITGSDF